MNRLTSKARITLLIIITLFSSALLSQTSLAKSSLSADDEAMFSQNNILFYEPCGGSGGKKSSEEICGSNQNYAGVQVFTDAQMKAIEANQPFYQEAAEKYDIPWEVIAVIHKREHGLARSNPDNGQGVYQFASAERRASCKGGNFSPGKISDEQFQIQTNCVADAIKNSYGSGLDLNTDDGIKKMFFKYNGMAQAYIDQALRLGFSQAEAENGEGSPYVMNRYDEKREPSSTWGQIKKDYGSIEYPANNDFGAFTAYKALACTGSYHSDDSDDDAESEDDNGTDNDSSSSSNISSSSDTAQKIAETALKLAYSYEDKGKAGGSPKQEFIDATTELGTWNKNKSHGPDCGYFVKAVIATVDPDIVYKPKDEKMDPFRNQLVSEKNSWNTKDNEYTKKYWDVIDFNDGDVSKLQSGDIIWGKNNGNKQHYFIVAEINGKLYKVEAHYNNGKGKWARVTKKLGKKFNTYTVQKIFRAKGSDGNSSNKPSCDAKADGSKNINATGAALAWPLGTKEEEYSKLSPNNGKPTPAFEKAFSELFPNYDNSTLYSYMEHPYCSGFTAVVVRYSGYDKHFTNSMDENQTTQADKADKDLWDVIDWNGDKSELQGGDIINCTAKDHSWMIIEDESGTLYVAQGSRSSWTFGHIEEYSNNCVGGHGKIIRAKHANNSSAGVSVTDGVKSSSTNGTITKTGKGNGDIGASAIELAWPQGTSDDIIQKSASEKFSKYFSSLSQSQSDKGKCYADGKSCDRFVGTAIRYSGVDSEFAFGYVDTGVLPYVESNDSWEEVKMNDSKTLKEYKSGDVLFFYEPGKDNPTHVAIYAEDSSGKGHLVQASYCKYFGVVQDTTNITSSNYSKIRVFRNKNNLIGGGGDSDCDLCPDDEESSGNNIDGNLQDGGFKSEEEADKAVMTEYRSLWNNDVLARAKYHIDVGCDNHLINNCPSFVRYFINKYTTKTWTGATGHGKDVAGNIAKAYDLETSNTPSAYSVFSVPEGITMCGAIPCGHTGIVLGVDVSRKKIIIGEAGCGMGLGFIKAKEQELSKYESGKYTFTNINDILKKGGGLQGE